MITRRTTLLTILVLLASGASQALASGRDVINDCTDDEVLAKTYTQKEYRDALKQLPADADQYGNCRDIIARAQDAAAGKGSKGKTTKGATTTTPATTSAGNTPGGGSTGEPSTKPAREQLATASAEDRAAVQEATNEPSAPEVVPSAVGASNGTDAGTSLSDLPAPILALLAFAVVGALGLGAVAIRRLVNARGA
jgi:hypothetical protein